MNPHPQEVGEIWDGVVSGVQLSLSALNESSVSHIALFILQETPLWLVSKAPVMLADGHHVRVVVSRVEGTFLVSSLENLDAGATYAADQDASLCVQICRRELYSEN
jgi:hypothetical protein